MNASVHPVCPALVFNPQASRCFAHCLAVRQLASPTQVTWQCRRFTNPARADGLELQHWVKCHKEVSTGMVKPVDGGEYQFAKYNKKVRPPAPFVSVSFLCTLDFLTCHVCGVRTVRARAPLPLSGFRRESEQVAVSHML